MRDQSISRRGFITSAAVAAAAVAQPKLMAQKRIPIALELYSLRQDAVKDLPGTLAAIVKMGYEGIELAGEKGGIRDTSAVYGRSAKELRKVFDGTGIKIFSAHEGHQIMLGDEFERTLEFNQIIGNPRPTISSLPPVKTIQEWYDYAKVLNEISARFKKHNMQLGYHNHTSELDLLEGKRPWDVILDNTSKDVTMQMHLAAFPSRNLDIVDYIKRYPGRARLTHVNDYAPGKRGAMIGEGVIEWKKVFNAFESVGGIECYIIEQESYPAEMTPLQTCERSLQNFRKLHG